MKKNYSIIKIVILLTCLIINKINAQCTNSNAYVSAAAPASGFTMQLSGCQFATEYSTLTGVVAGNSYSTTSTIGTDFITIHSGTFNGPVVAFGVTPLIWTASIAGNYYVHVNTNASCGQNTSCRNLFVGCFAGPINDLCANATSVAVVGTYTGTTLLATTETPAVPSCITSAPSQPGVWYTLTGNGNKIGVSLCATSGWDSKIWIFTGACGAFTCVTGNDDGGPFCAGLEASVTWCSQIGVQYRILVAGFSSSSNFTLNTTQTVIATPTITASQNPICNSYSATLTGLGNSTYSWMPGAFTGSVQIVSPSATTNYTVTGTSSGCQAPTAFITLSVNPNPTVSVNSGSICSGNSFTMSPSGASSYTYSSGSAVVSPTTNSSYTVTGSVAGCTNTAISNVTVNAIPLIAISGNTYICVGGTVNLTASGANTYTWNTSATTNTISDTPLINTTYTASGTNVLGCIGNSTQFVIVNVNPTITVANGTVCIGDSFTLVPSGAFTYTYSTGPVVTPSATTSYSIFGTSAAGCSSLTIASVNVNPLPVVSALSSASLICNGQTASLTASGANTYSWNTSATTTVVAVSPTVTTSYTVIGTSNGCTNVATITQSVSACTGIDSKLASLSGVVIYPNPTTGLFTVELNNGSSKTIEVMDVTGRIVLANTTSNDKVDFNINTLVNGVYYVKIQSTSSIEVIRIIKQ